jgi:cell division topological specificity factor
VLDFFKSLFRPPSASGETAKERLRLVLLSDHLSLAPDVVESLKRDLLDVISRYVEIDFDHADVTFEQREREVAMLANIPIRAVRERPRPSGDLPFNTEPVSVAPVAPEPEPVVEEPAPVLQSTAVAAPAQTRESVELATAKTDVATEPRATQPNGAAHVDSTVPETAVASKVEATNGPAGKTPTVEKATTAAQATDAPQLELAAAAPKAKPARSGNAAGTRRRRRKKYAAQPPANAKHSPPGQQLGGQASAQA